MRRISILFSLTTVLALGPLACARDDDARSEATSAESDAGDGREITVTGCLTGAPDRAAFAITANRSELTSGALYSRSGEVPTYTYELVGGTDLASHIGREVRVTGRLGDRDDEVDVEAEAKTQHPEVRDGKPAVTPAIETNEEVEIRVRRLHVASVTPTGDGCLYGQ